MQDLEPNEQRAKLAILLIWIVLALEIASLASGYVQYSLLKTIAGGTQVSQEIADQNDAREAAISTIYLVAYLVSAVTFIRWFKRAYSNLHKKVTNLSFTVGWAAGCWFVPVISFYRPYQIMKEMYIETKKILNIEDLSTRLLGLWWALWLIGTFIGNVLFRSSLKAETLDQIIVSTVGSMIGNVIGIPLALITIKVIKDYSKAESLLNTSGSPLAAAQT